MMYPHDDGPEFGTVNHNQITVPSNCDLQSIFGCVNSSAGGNDINYATEPLQIVGGYVNHGKRVIDYICKTKSHKIIIRCKLLVDRLQWPQAFITDRERERFTVNIINEGSDHYSRVSFIRLGDAYNYVNYDHIVEKVSVIVTPLHDVDPSPLPDGMYINSVHQRVATYHDEASLVVIFNKIRSGKVVRTTDAYSLKIPLKFHPKKIGSMVTRLNDLAVNKCAVRLERRNKFLDKTLHINTLKGYESEDIVIPESIQSPILRTNGIWSQEDVYKETYREYAEAFERYFHGVQP